MKTRVFRKKMKSKLIIVFLLFMVGLVFVIGHIIYINAVKGSEYGLKVLSQQDSSSVTIPYKRGDVLDRNGNVLATSVKVYNVILDPVVLLDDDEENLEESVDALVRHFQVNKEEVISKIREKSSSRYVILLKKLSYETVKPFKEEMNKEDSNIVGVWFEDEYERNYPFSSLAATVIGYTNSGNAGSWGIEEYYNSTLNGTDGRRFSYVNSENTMETIIKNAKDGNSVMSTIDINVQKIVEEKIASWKAQYNPVNVACIVANPNNGEILGMSSSKNLYDLNNPRDLTPFYSEQELQEVLAEEMKRYTEEEQAAMTEEEKEMITCNRVWRNYCISDSYEAGSTIKPFTVAAALEEGVISKDQSFMCDGVEAVGGWQIHCHKRSGHGGLNVTQAIMQSCNDALMQISFKLGKDAFCEYQSRFGFGLKTGIDLPGEVSCASLMYTPSTMDSSTLATNSFGQNFNVTMVQMVAGFSALINGGTYYEPHVAKQVVNSDGAIVENVEKRVVKQVVTKDTTDFLRNALHETVVAGTGKTAAVVGYETAGKTGTAQINGRRGEDVYVLSFMGYAPFDDPEIVCYVLVDEPAVSDPASSSYASRLFSEIMTEVLPYMGVYSNIEVPETPQVPEETQVVEEVPQDEAQPAPIIDNPENSVSQGDENYEGPLYGDYAPDAENPEDTQGEDEE